MISLYGRLFTYRERRHRRPLEDFLTEALCDILNRLPLAEMAEFVADLFLPAAAREIWRQQFGEANDLRWETQESIGSDGRPDLILRCDGHPLIVVENKIGAGIGQRQAATGGDKDTRDQLMAYGQWLKGQCAARDWPGAIVLLTHFTSPPDRFGADETAFGVEWQHVCRWPAVWRWLASSASRVTDNCAVATWQALAAELVQFLREKDMTSETMTLYDLAAAEMYIGSAARVSSLFNRIWNEGVYPVWREGYGHTDAYVSRGSIEYCTDGAKLWD